MALPCLGALLILKDTLPHCLWALPPPPPGRYKSSVWISKGAIYLYTGTHFYGFLQPAFSTLFFLILKWEKEKLILYSIKMFSTTFPDDICTWRVKGICVWYHVFNDCGGRMARRMGAYYTADCLFHMTHPSSCDKKFLFLPPLGSLCMKRKPLNDKPRLQVPCRGQRPAETAAAAATLHWHDGMKGCMPAPARLPLPSLTFSPSLIYFCCVDYF